jgi:hypothetical protein
MRLRQLGTTQSVTFIAPPEVHQSIRDICYKRAEELLDSSDVVFWLLHQTCASNRQLHSLYFWQGTDFCYRTQAATRFDSFLSDVDHREEYLKYLQQPEQQTLEELYGPRVPTDDGVASKLESHTLPLSNRLCEFMKILQQNYHPRTSDEDFAAHSALEEVEQQREVSIEAQQERELQRPYFVDALEFPGLHQAIQEFVQTGLLSGRNTCPKASTILTSTRLWRKQPKRPCSLISRLFLSPEFARTVQLDVEHESDNFIVSTELCPTSRPTGRAFCVLRFYLTFSPLASCQLGSL